jgi:inner membrane protein
MDPLSHALLGAASAQSIARGSRHTAAIAGLLGALLPDADVLVSSDADPLLALEYHRQFTHSFALAPVGALIVAAVMWFVLRRRIAFGSLYWPALAGYASALLLDACTSYGTQLLWPFTDTRFAASIVAVIDPVVTVVLLIGVVLALKSSGPKAARVAIGVVLAYLAVGWVQHERAQSLIERTAARRGHTIVEHQVKPTLGNLLLWRSVYLAGDELVVDAVRAGVASAPFVYPGGSVRRIQPIDLVPPLSMNSIQAADLVRFAKVSEGFLARHPERPYVIGDIRYAMLPDSTEPLWGIAVHAERETEHVEFRTFRELTKEDRQKFFAMLRGVAPENLRASAAQPRRAP